MEDTLRELIRPCYAAGRGVLILVLMEDTLREDEDDSTEDNGES